MMSATILPISSASAELDVLVDAVRRGEAWAKTMLYDRHAPDVSRVLVAVLGPDSELRDVLHETFVEAFEGIGRLRESDRLGPWLRQIAVHRARACIRRRKRYRILHALGLADVPETPIASVPPEAREALAETYRVLNEMSADLRIPFTLRHVEGLELTEVAAACDVSLATIKRRLVTAEAKFAALARRNGKLDDWLTVGGFQ